MSVTNGSKQVEMSAADDLCSELDLVRQSDLSAWGVSPGGASRIYTLRSQIDLLGTTGDTEINTLIHGDVLPTGRYT